MKDSHEIRIKKINAKKRKSTLPQNPHYLLLLLVFEQKIFRQNGREENLAAQTIIEGYNFFHSLHYNGGEE